MSSLTPPNIPTRRSKSGSKEEEVVEAVDEIDDVDVCIW
jgi:hypothetical protein